MNTGTNAHITMLVIPWDKLRSKSIDNVPAMSPTVIPTIYSKKDSFDNCFLPKSFVTKNKPIIIQTDLMTTSTQSGIIIPSFFSLTHLGHMIKILYIEVPLALVHQFFSSNHRLFLQSLT